MATMSKNSVAKNRSKMIVINSKLSSSTIKSHITVSKDLEKYYRCYSFYSSYDEEIIANNSILNIPILSIVLPFAWVTGADVYVEELDRTFAESMIALQQQYKKIYPRAPFKTKVFVEKIVENKQLSEGTALLFSGGLDSTYSLFSNKTRNPRLIMIFGVADIPISNIEFQEILRKDYSNFAKREGLKINYIRTNAMEILDRARMNHLWWKYKGRHEGDFWNGLGFSLGQLGQAAPLSIGRFHRLLIASAIKRTEEDVPVASSPDIDEKIAWGRLHVEHDGYLNRYEKVLSLKKILEENRIKLRVCWLGPRYLLKMGGLNCGKCEKCLRTIVSLVLAGINPNDCGFKVDNSTFIETRRLFEKRLLTHQHVRLWWEPLRQRISDGNEVDIFGSDHFFKWFRYRTLDLYAKPYRTPLSPLYHNLPYSIYNILKIIYEHMKSVQHWIFKSIEPDIRKTLPKYSKPKKPAHE